MCACVRVDAAQQFSDSFSDSLSDLIVISVSGLVLVNHNLILPQFVTEMNMFFQSVIQ